MSISTRDVLRTAVVSGVGVTVLALAATTAFAKSDIEVSVGPHSMHIGRMIHASGHGDDDNASFNRFCLQERADRSGWHTVRCSHGAFNGGGSVNLGIRATHRGIIQFRGVLVEGSTPQDRHPKVHGYSRTIIVDVH